MLLGSACLLVSGCGLLGGRSREQKLLAALESGDQAQKRETLLALRGEATPAVCDAVERILATDVEPRARAFAADALGRSGRWGSTLELRRSARSDSDRFVRARALAALVQILGPVAGPDVEYSLANDPHPAVRVEAVNLASAVLAGKQGAALIVEGLKDEVLEVKLSAYLALKDLTGQEIPPNDYDGWREHVDGM